MIGLGYGMEPLSSAIAPEQSEDLARSTTAPDAPQTIDYRGPVDPVLDVPHRTVSAGTETAAVPMFFSLPDSLRRVFGGKLTGGLRRTLIQAELQSDITTTDRVMKPKGMNRPYVIPEPSAWYAGFTETL